MAKFVVVRKDGKRITVEATENLVDGPFLTFMAASASGNRVNVVLRVSFDEVDMVFEEGAIAEEPGDPGHQA